MNPVQSPTPDDEVVTIEKVTKKLEEATLEFEQATSKLEEATELRKALGKAGVLDTPKLKLTHYHAVNKAMKEQNNATKNLRKELKNGLTTFGQSTEDEARKLIEVRDSAAEVLAKLPGPAFDWVKVWSVLGCVLATAAIAAGLIWHSPNGKSTLIIGLVTAAIGQFLESAKKADDVQRYPRFMDGLALYGEAVKILGALTALVGAILKT